MSSKCQSFKWVSCWLTVKVVECICHCVDTAPDLHKEQPQWIDPGSLPPWPQPWVTVRSQSAAQSAAQPAVQPLPQSLPQSLPPTLATASQTGNGRGRPCDGSRGTLWRWVEGSSRVERYGLRAELEQEAFNGRQLVSRYEMRRYSGGEHVPPLEPSAS